MPSTKKLTSALATVGLCLAFAVIPLSAHALASDRDQPMNIEADSLRHDDAQQVTVFTGNVVVTKGSIVLRGDKLTVKQTADGAQHGTLQAGTDQRAFFSQQRDTPAGAPTETVQGQAKTIEYNGATDQVKLINDGELRRFRAGALNDEITGALIVYNNSTGQFDVDGKSRQTGSTGGGHRVRAVIGASTTSKADKPSAAVPLKPSPTLNN